jgi:hypothetical protein
MIWLIALVAFGCIMEKVDNGHFPWEKNYD